MEPGTRNREQQGRVIASQALFPVPWPLAPGVPCSRRCYHVPVITEGWADHLAGPFGIAFAFAAGVISFLSPCVLPLVPAYIAHLTGVASPPGFFLIVLGLNLMGVTRVPGLSRPSQLSLGGAQPALAYAGAGSARGE